MTKKVPEKRTSGSRPAEMRSSTLGNLLAELKSTTGLSPVRQRDLCSAVRRIAKLLDNDPAAIPLDMPAISAGLARVNPVAAGLSEKRLSNIRSDFLAAVSAAGFGTVKRVPRSGLSGAWAALLGGASKRFKIGLSRLAHFASGEGIDPIQFNDTAMARFVESVRQGSLNPSPLQYHRKVAAIWNELAKSGALELRILTIPSSQQGSSRFDLSLLPASFLDDQENYLEWCRSADEFDQNARRSPLAASTIQLRRNQIHSAVTALVESGVPPAAITGLASLVEPEAFKRILRRRIAITGNETNAFNHGLGAALLQLALDWVKPDSATLAELKRLFSKVKAPPQGLTSKNTKFLRQFDDPEVGVRLYRLAGDLFAEAKRDPRQNVFTLAKAQAALAIELLCYMPIRAQNLTELTFDQHIFLKDHVRGTSSLELASEEVKNDNPIAFDIPVPLAKMLREYRERLAPRIIGHRPTRLFVNIDGSPKGQEAISGLIIRYARRRAGIILTPHQFRHLNAKLILDDSPGAFETVRQVLGHKSLKTTTGSYTGINTRRAARHHHRLIREMLAKQPKRTRVRTRRRLKIGGSNQ